MKHQSRWLQHVDPPGTVAGKKTIQATRIVPDRPQACGPGHDAVRAGLRVKDARDLTPSDLLVIMGFKVVYCF